MKKIISFVLLAVFLPSTLRAEPEVDQTIKVFAEQYAKEKIKEQLEEFLNANPDILFSPGAEELGTEAMKYVGVMMHAFNFLNAETDKQKLFAAVGAAAALYSIPYAGWALLAIQMVDLAVSLDHQKQLAEIYKQVKEIQLRTIRILEQVYTLEFTEQIRIIQRIQSSQETITSLIAKLNENSLFIALSEGKNAEVSTEDVEKAYEYLSDLQRAFLDYDMALIFFNEIVDIKVLGEVNLSETLATFEQNIKPLREKIGLISKGIFDKFVEVKANTTWAIINQKTIKKNTELNRYVRCAEITNDYASFVLGSSSEEQDIFETEELTLLCVEKYSWEIAGELF